MWNSSPILKTGLEELKNHPFAHVRHVAFREIKLCTPDAVLEEVCRKDPAVVAVSLRRDVLLLREMRQLVI